MHSWSRGLTVGCLAVFGFVAQPAFAAGARVDNTPVDPVVQWNRILLGIVRTPNEQPATVHPTRSFAIMHAAIVDAVTAIDRKSRPYSTYIDNVSRFASQEAAVDAA